MIAAAVAAPRACRSLAVNSSEAVESNWEAIVEGCIVVMISSGASIALELRSETKYTKRPRYQAPSATYFVGAAVLLSLAGPAAQEPNALHLGAGSFFFSLPPAAVEASVSFAASMGSSGEDATMMTSSPSVGDDTDVASLTTGPPRGFFEGVEGGSLSGSLARFEGEAF